MTGLQTTQTTQQQLQLAPHLALALEVLRMPIMELQTFLQQQAQENPLLEVYEPAEERDSRDSPENAQMTHSDSPDGPDDRDQEWEDPSERQELSSSSQADFQSIERYHWTGESLHAWLMKQLGCQKLSAHDYSLAEALVYHLNESGYLEVELTQLTQELHVEAQQLEGILQTIQGLDPAGVGSRNLQECLMIQLQHRHAQDSLSYRMLRDHFPLVVQQRVSALAKAMRVPISQVASALEQIKQLNPKPGSYFAHPISSACLVPDLIIIRRENYYDVELNDERMPSLWLNRAYQKMLRDPHTPSEAKEFLATKFRQAQWVIRAIDERQTTLLSIGRCLLSLQRDFLDQGPQALKPLTQAQVAKLIGRHPSTVSRAIADKSISSPWGVLRLEEWFPSYVPQNHSDEHVSETTIKAQMQRLVGDEDARHPLSDEALVKKLAERHIRVARRTIAKYRTSLKILPAYLRKQRF